MQRSVSDQELITGCIEGQKESWDVFVERFSRLVYWSIRKTMETSSYRERTDLVREIFQDFFVRLLEKKKLENLRSCDKIRKFLTVMACHMTMDKIRSITRSEKRISEDISSVAEWVASADPAFGSVSAERDALAANALNELSPKQRLCVEWHFMDGKTHREISEILGLPQDTVSAVIRRAREKLNRFFLEKDQ